MANGGFDRAARHDDAVENAWHALLWSGPARGFRRREHDVVATGGNRQDRRSFEQQPERQADRNRIERRADSIIERDGFGSVGESDPRVR